MGNQLPNHQKQINHQRVFHIVASYQLAEEDDTFAMTLDDLLDQYPSPLIELAIVEVLVQTWTQVPLVRGSAFLVLVTAWVQHWTSGLISPTITPDIFECITGLTPYLVFRNTLVLDPQTHSQPSST